MKSRVKTLSVTELASLVNLQRRQIANLAKAGQIPDVTQPDGYHFQYNDTPALRRWIKDQMTEKPRIKGSRWSQRARKASVLTPGTRGSKTGLNTIQGVSFFFDRWVTAVGGEPRIKNMSSEQLVELLEHLEHPEKIINLVRSVLARRKN